MNKMEKIRETKARYQAELMRKKGVLGCAIGYKYKGRKKTGELCIVCYVNEKKTRDRIGKYDLIPEEIEGIPTDVVESGSFGSL